MKTKWILLVLLIASFALAEKVSFVRTTGSQYCLRILNSDNAVYDHVSHDWLISGATDPNGYLNCTQDANTPIIWYATFPDTNTPANTYSILVFDTNTADVNAVTNYSGGIAYPWSGSNGIALNDVVDANGRVDVGYLNGSSSALTYLATLADGWLATGGLYEIIIKMESSAALGGDH